MIDLILFITIIGFRINYKDEIIMKPQFGIVDLLNSWDEKNI